MLCIHYFPIAPTTEPTTAPPTPSPTPCTKLSHVSPTKPVKPFQASSILKRKYHHIDYGA